MARADMCGLFWDDTPPPKPPKKEKEKRQPPERTWERDDYLPYLQEALAFNFNVMSDHELYDAYLRQERFVFDVESYWNYFIAGFASIDTGRVWYAEFRKDEVIDIQRLKWVIDNILTVGFNSIGYDLPILALALAGHTTEQLKAATNEIIVNQVQPSFLLRQKKVKKLRCNHIDLIEVAPLQASLKMYGGRIGCQKMQDLPFQTELYLSDEQIAITRLYNLNDLANTAGLYKALTEQIKLRETLSEEYGVDVRSKSDAQIAEAVIAAEITGLNNGVRPQRPEIAVGTWYRYNVPHFMRFYSPTMQWTLELVRNALFIVDESGAVGMPRELADLEINIANGVYRMGIGGLHSSEKSTAHVADENYVLEDTDVTSYYPFIILNLGLFPQHLGQNFLRVYRSIVERRLTAKSRAKELKKLVKETNDILQKAGYEAELKVVSTAQDSLKITINGSFGKLGSKYSVLYSPDLLIQVTVTGQLCLLMLIERFEMSGITVVSANTDGIVTKCPRHLLGLRDAIVKQWEQETQFETESVRYRGLYSRDVNNYIAIKEDGEAKTKGVFVMPEKGKFNLQKNPQNQICAESVVQFLSKGIPIEKTIRECTDIRKFVTVRNVKGGAVKVYDTLPLPGHGTKEDLVRMAGFYEFVEGYWIQQGESDRSSRNLDDAYESAKKILTRWSENEYLGKSIRWYYGKDITGEIVYAGSGNKVPRSEGAKPCMELPAELPNDIDYDWYINEANEMLKQVGYC